MSKLDMARGMSLEPSRERQTPDREPSEAEALEMRLYLLQQMDAEKLKSSAELMKTLRDLHGCIKGAAMSVQQAAREVREYPAEVISQHTGKVEQSVKICAESAERARQTYDAATALVSKVEKYMGAWVIAASLLTASGMGAIVAFILR